MEIMIAVLLARLIPVTATFMLVSMVRSSSRVRMRVVMARLLKARGVGLIARRAAVPVAKNANL